MLIQGMNMQNLRTTCGLVVVGSCVLLALGCGTVAKTVVMNNPKVEKILTDPPLDRTVTHSGHFETIGDDDNRITVLYVTGTSYEMGYEHGLLLGAQVRETIADVQVG